MSIGHIDTAKESGASEATSGAASFQGPELSVIVPCLNERDNIRPLVERLRGLLSHVAWEVIFVDDDSVDGTRDEVKRLAEQDGRVRLLHRIGKRGLSSACIEGVQASTARYVAVMDADLQHDESLLPRMFQALKEEQLDLVVGSRYVDGGGVGEWDSKRIGISSFATRLGQLILKVKIADPMSGFFMMRRDAFDGAVRRLSAMGFKILLDLLASSPKSLRLKELPYQFRPRVAGESKLDAQVAWEYLMLLADKMIGHIVPVRFVLFSIVGCIGVVATLVVAWFCLKVLGFPFTYAQTIATGIAMIGNFALNNVLTYSDRRLKGWRFISGLISFSLICSIGAVGNVGVASFLFHKTSSSWWLDSIAGIAVGSVWNYAVSAVVTWKKS
jgi:dolichol-phosphate mannosyltransferase